MTEENSAPEAEQPKPRRGRPPKQKVEPEAPAPAPAAEPEPEPKTSAGTVHVDVVANPVVKVEPKASIGRIVRYVTAQGSIRPAIISGLVEEDEVQLTVFNSQGAVFVDHVPFAPNEAEVPGTYHWPTFD